LTPLVSYCFPFLPSRLLLFDPPVLPLLRRACRLFCLVVRLDGLHSLPPARTTTARRELSSPYSPFSVFGLKTVQPHFRYAQNFWECSRQILPIVVCSLRNSLSLVRLNDLRSSHVLDFLPPPLCYDCGPFSFSRFTQRCILLFLGGPFSSDAALLPYGSAPERLRTLAPKESPYGWNVPFADSHTLILQAPYGQLRAPSLAGVTISFHRLYSTICPRSYTKDLRIPPIRFAISIFSF